MTDNVIEFQKGVQGKAETAPEPTGPTADDILKDSLGKYKDVIIIGITEDRAQCLATLGLDEAVYELSRALHRLHCHIDRA